MYALSSSRWPGVMQLRPVVTSTRRLVSSLLHPRYSQARAASSSRTAKQQLERRPVVSSFLYKYVRENDEVRAKVALFKRSDQVRTYRHRWAVISGSIEPDDPSPLAAAWREIYEETTLTPSSLELMRQGKSYSLPDESIGREWIINPFAFRLKDISEGGKGEAGITLDWEHETWAWYDPMDIEDSESFGAVPRLAESLRRVWFEKDLGPAAGNVLAESLDIMKSDHLSTARQLALTSLLILRDIMLEMDARQPIDAWWTKVKFAAWHIWKNGTESLCAPVLNALLAALSGMEERLHETKKSTESNSVPTFRNALVAELDRHITAAEQDVTTQVSSALIAFLREHFAAQEESGRPLKVLAVSDSSTLRHALRHVASNTRFHIDLRILEGRPSFEGTSLARSLLRESALSQKIPLGISDGKEHGHSDRGSVPQLKLTVYADAASAVASDDVDLVLIGTDALIESGAVHHRTGAIPAILSGRHASEKAKTVVLSESSKVTHSKIAGAYSAEPADPADLTRVWKAGCNSEGGKKVAGTLSSGLGGNNATTTQPEHGNTAASQAPVDVRDVSMEWIPPNLVDVYILEHGIRTVEDISKLSEALAADEARLFRHI